MRQELLRDWFWDALWKRDDRGDWGMSMIGSSVSGTSTFKAFGVPGAINRQPRFSGEHVRSRPNYERKSRDRTFSPAAESNSADEEFLKRRDRLAGIGRKNPTARLAAFLVAIVHLNSDKSSGDPVISEKTDSSFVADLLGIEMDELMKLLLQFQSRGLVMSMPNGSLQITNLAALERLADGHALPNGANASEDFTMVHRIISEPPRVYSRSTAEAVSLSQFDNAVRFDVVSIASAACLVVALAVAYGIIGF